MDRLHRLPYPEHLVHLFKQCEEWIPKSLTKRALLVGVTAGFVVYVITKKRYRLPPGPRGWPLIGNLLDFQDTTIYEKLMEWKTQYGPVITIHMGPQAIVTLNNAEVVLEALVKKQADFAGRPQSYSNLLISHGGKSIIFGDYSPTWKLHRKLATKALRYYMGGTKLEEGLERTLAVGIKELKQHKGPFNPHTIMSLIVFNIINSICFNYTCGIQDHYFRDMVGILDAFLHEFGDGVAEDYIPPLRLFPTKQLRKLLSTANRFFSYIETDIHEHRQTFTKDNIRDFCDAMLLAQEEAREEEDPEVMSQFTDEHIIQTLGDVFEAGLDTSRYTLMWSLLYLAWNPDVQKKVHREIDQVFGDRTYPKLSDRSSLPYTDAVLHEVMRISTVAPMGVPHSTTCDTTIGKYDLPRGTMVMINHYALHHDPEQWPNPEEFKPERFLDQHGKMAPKPDSWLPFSAGRRVCMGESVAKPELHLLLAGIMRQFKVSPPTGADISFESCGGSFANVPKDFEIVVESRSW